ncbi:MAG: polyprenol monophosphomannose synthase [Patescibacteria group bacterium]
MKKFIIIPTYNEKENIGRLIKEIFDLNISDLNIIVVDDNSPDGTGEIVNGLVKKYNNAGAYCNTPKKNVPIQAIHRKEKSGLGSAYVAGFKKALANKADLIFEMDADFSHDPKDIPRFIDEINRGYDIVIGSRRIEGGSVKGWSFRRDFQSKCAMAFARLMLGLKTRDITAGFRCFRAKVLESIDLDKITSSGYAFQEELIYFCEKKKFHIKEIPVTFIDRQHGKSKLGINDIIEFFAAIFRLKFKNEDE